MVGRRGLKNFTYHAASWIQAISVTAASFLGWSLNVTIEKLPPSTKDAFQWMREESWWLIPTLGAFALIGQAVKWKLGSPWAWATVHALLDDIGNRVFPPSTHPNLAEHRVTLFRHTKLPFCWKCIRISMKFSEWAFPWHGWLLPVERSGHVTRNSMAAFWVPDEGDKVEGVAGQAWVSRKCIHVDSLMELHKESSDHNIKKYAKRTYINHFPLTKKVRNGAKLACSLHAVPVEVKNMRWGVLVFDSTCDKMKTEAEITEICSSVLLALSKVLEKT